MPNRIIVAALVTTAVVHHADACPAKGTGTLDQIVTTWIQQNQPGSEFGMCAVALDSKGHEGFACGGKADGSHGLTKDTLFEIGSVTKTVTATLFALRVTQGRYNLHSLVDPHMPAQFRMGALDPVTMLQLATHHAGLPKIPPAYNGANGDYAAFDTFLIEWLGHPPTTYLYSNWGFQLLGYTIAHDDGTDWFTDVDLDLFQPLQMFDTATYEEWQNVDPDYFEAHAASLHTADGGDLGNGPASSCPTADPSGCLYSSPHDMRIWLQYAMRLIDPQISGDPRSLLRKSYDTAGDATTQQGLAWSFNTDDSTACDVLPKPFGGQTKYTRVAKSGDIDPGAHTYILYLQDPNDPNGKSPLGVVLLTNSDNSGPTKLNDMAFDLLARLPLP